MLAFNSTTDRYLQFLDALQQAAIATTATGEIVDWNRSAEGLYGWRRAEAIGRNIVDVTPSMVSRDEAAAIMASLGRGDIWSGEFPVRTRGGETFVASVTDIPIGEAGRIVGVVGVSARSHGPASLDSLLIRFGAACDAIWPGCVAMTAPRLDSFVPASEPHLLQLLALILIRYAGTLDMGARIDVFAGPATESIFADFGFRSRRPYVYIRFGERTESPSYSLLRDEISAARPTNYAAALVRLVGGWLFEENAGGGSTITHLLLPID